jgi:hypothetical protein
VARFVLLVLLFAAMVYAVMWGLERRRAGGKGGGRPAGFKRLGRPPAPPPRQVAPDDDEDFLRWLDRKRRKDKDAGG